MLQELEKRKIQSQKPILFGEIINDNICIMIIEYIEGIPAIEAFKKCSNSIQHQIGLRLVKNYITFIKLKPQLMYLNGMKYKARNINIT